MSSLETTSTTPPDLGGKPAAGQDPQKLRDELKRLFDQPELLPDKLLGFIVDYLAVNQPAIPISQIFGFQQFAANQAAAAAAVTTTSTSYVSLSGGPKLSALGDGNYVLLYGVQSSTDTVGKVAYASPSVNGGAATDAVAAVGVDVTNEGSRMSATIAALSAGGVNTVELLYKSFGGTATARFLGRWLIAIRFANL